MRFLPLILRNLLRSKLRTLLTGAAVAVAVALVCLMRTMPAALEHSLEKFGSELRFNVHSRTGMTYTLPYAHLQKIRALPGVEAAATWTWFGGIVEDAEGVAFPNFATEPDAYAVVWSENGVSPQAIEEWGRQRNGAIVGRQPLRRYGWKIGDLVTLQSKIYDIGLEFRIVGEIPYEMNLFFFQREYLAQAIKEKHDWELDYFSILGGRASDASRVPGLLREIDGLFRNSDAPTASETERAYNEHFLGLLQDFVQIVQVVAALVALCVLFIAANSASMSVRERIHEVGVLRAVGFEPGIVFGILVAETALLATVAGAIGAVASIGVGYWLRAHTSLGLMAGPLATFDVTPSILLQGIALAFSIGVLSALPPGLGAVRRDVAGALREVF